MVTREALNKLKPQTWVVIYDEQAGRRRALFVRVTRAGKGNDVVVDVPKYDRGGTKPSDYTRRVIPMGEVLSVVKASRPKAGRKIEVTEPEAWRALAEEAIRELREFATDADDELRASAFRRVVALERKMAALAGQGELIKS